MMDLGKAVRPALEVGSGIRVVSFDVFDTVLLRRFSADRVVALELRLFCDALAVFDAPADPAMVTAHRARWCAKMAESYRRGEAEWTVEEWGHALAEEVGLEPGLVVDAARSASLSSERLATLARCGAQDLLDSLSGEGVIVVATSDTWMPEDLLAKLLAEKGLRFDRVYASGSRGYSKRRGGLFAVVTEDLEVAPEQVLHVGDNWKGDWVRPRQAGWRSTLVSRDRAPVPSPRVAALGPWSRHRHQVRDVAEALSAPPAGEGLERIGHAHLAPLLCAFHLVQEQIFERRRVELAVYLARDAHLMARARELLDPGGRPARYLRLSRRAISLAHPADLLGSGTGIAGRFGQRQVGQFLGAFAVPELWAAELLDDAGLDASSPLDPAGRLALRRALSRRSAEIGALRVEQRALIVDLLAAEGVAGRSGIGVVDTGWAGTTQDALRACLEPSSALTGVYLGVSAAGLSPVESSTKYGLLRDDYRPMPFANALDRAGGTLRVWDTVFREPHATVRQLSRGVDGRVSPVLDERTWPDARQAELTADLCRGVERGVRDRRAGVEALAAFGEAIPLLALEAFSSSVSRRLVAYPARREARALLALRYEEADGGRWDLGWGAVRDRTAWYPGLVAAEGGWQIA